MEHAELAVSLSLLYVQKARRRCYNLEKKKSTCVVEEEGEEPRCLHSHVPCDQRCP